MIKSFVLIALAALSLPAFAQDYPVISGNIEGIPDGAMIFIQQATVKTDSTISKNGSFNFRLKRVAQPFVANLLYENSSGKWNFLTGRFIVANGTLKIEGNTNELKNLKFTGSKENDIYIKMNRDIIKWQYHSKEIIEDSLKKAGKSTNEVFSVIKQKIKELLNNSANKFPNYFAVASSIYDWNSLFTKDEIKVLLNGSMKNSKYTLYLKALLYLKKGVPLDFTVSDIKGKNLQIKSKVKRETLLVFWATWCPGCLEEIKFLEGLDLSKLPFDVVLISCDKNLKAWENYSSKLTWCKDSFLIPQPEFKMLGITSIPRAILVDKDGIVVDPEFDVYGIGK